VKTKILLVLNLSSPTLIVIDRSEARNVPELIKLVPEIQKESAN
jgi:hypothetical protein